MRVQFGAGGTRLPGFDFNHDLEVPIEQPLPYEDYSVDMVVANHVVEHITSGQALDFLTEVHRILKVGGFARICCPLIGQWLHIDHAKDLCRGHGHKMILNEQSMRDLFWMAGFNAQKIRRVDFDPDLETHHLVIGCEKNNIETCRILAEK